MKLRSTVNKMIIAGTMACLAILSGCGGGGSGTHPINLTLTAANVPAGVQLGALKTTISLPAGISIPADSAGQVNSGAIVMAGTAATGTSQLLGNYQDASRKLVISLVNTAGFGNGDFLVVKFEVNNDTTVSAADFSIIVNEAKDNGPAYGPVVGVSVTCK